MGSRNPIKPPHYSAGSQYEHYKVVRVWGLSYCLGCATKYICRAGKKPGVKAIEDLRKAIRYLFMEIDNLEYQRSATRRSKRRL